MVLITTQIKILKEQPVEPTENKRNKSMKTKGKNQWIIKQKVVGLINKSKALLWSGKRKTTSKSSKNRL